LHPETVATTLLQARMRVRTTRQAKIKTPYPTTRDQREVANLASTAWDLSCANPAFPLAPFVPEERAYRNSAFAIGASSVGEQPLGTHLDKFV
jgi:hypothetical protein